ncbi:sialic acid TRAP transporter permease protein SiaT [Striga asiatica]|uniref:Sialic acid TRAP transporter permease protein SiaT n=1 Tax=Striga asiatica TaxID=4170 RepID=A0A5A7P7B4_STRAF|nr:sialic acid TRAP transporter permease protein SiaT [Striga asiatica]
MSKEEDAEDNVRASIYFTAPDLGRREHPPVATHVPEGSLAGDAGNTGDGAAGSPGLGGGQLAGVSGDGVGLAGVVGELAMDEDHDVGADGTSGRATELTPAAPPSVAMSFSSGWTETRGRAAAAAAAAISGYLGL